MSLLDPKLKQRLGRSRLRPLRAEPSGGIGERRSKRLGPGMEFADHRPYQFGDDIRFLDPHVHARLGEHYVKLFSLQQSLEVTVLLDASASMAFGTPQKYRFAAALAASLTYVCLCGGDAVTVATLVDDDVAWFPRLTGVQRSEELFRWLEHRRPRGSTGLAAAARSVADRLQSGGVAIVLSDWLTDEFEAALRLFEAAGQEVVGVHVLAPEEVEPEGLAAGAVSLYDAERNDGPLAMTFDAFTLDRYRTELTRFRAELTESLRRRGGRYFPVRSDQRLERVLLRDWRAAGLLW